MKKNQKIYKRESVNNAMHIMVCPGCDTVCASASERMYIPEWTACSDKNCQY